MSPTFTSDITVEEVDHLGSDLTVVNAARVSFQSVSHEFTQKDARLVSYLAKHKHYSPFRHCMIQFKLTLPEFAARQFYKHVVGAECTSTHPTKDHAWNEMSGRYKAYEDVFIPSTWFSQHELAKQCSGPPLEPRAQDHATAKYQEMMERLWATYEECLALGMAKEQARMMLPMSIMTEVVWTASLQAIQNFVALRNADDAQTEIRTLAQQMDAIAKARFPISYTALMQA